MFSVCPQGLTSLPMFSRTFPARMLRNPMIPNTSFNSSSLGLIKREYSWWRPAVCGPIRTGKCKQMHKSSGGRNSNISNSKKPRSHHANIHPWNDSGKPGCLNFNSIESPNNLGRILANWQTSKKQIFGGLGTRKPFAILFVHGRYTNTGLRIDK